MWLCRRWWHRRTEVVITTASGATTNNKVGILTNLSFQLCRLGIVIDPIPECNDETTVDPRFYLHCLLSIEKRQLSWCHWRHGKLSLWQPLLPPVTTNLASWQLSLVSNSCSYACVCGNSLTYKRFQTTASHFIRNRNQWPSLCQFHYRRLPDKVSTRNCFFFAIYSFRTDDNTQTRSWLIILPLCGRLNGVCVSFTFGCGPESLR